MLNRNAGGLFLFRFVGSFRRLFDILVHLPLRNNRTAGFTDQRSDVRLTMASVMKLNNFLRATEYFLIFC